MKAPKNLSKIAIVGGILIAAYVILLAPRNRVIATESFSDLPVTIRVVELDVPLITVPGFEANYYEYRIEAVSSRMVESAFIVTSISDRSDGAMVEQVDASTFEIDVSNAARVELLYRPGAAIKWSVK